MAELVQYYGTGRRKRAIARVYLRPGSGDFKVNGRAFEEYFVTPAQRSAAKAPLASTDTAAVVQHHRQCSGRRSARPGRRGEAGHCARFDAVQCRTAREAEVRGHGHARLARQGTEEVRSEGRPQALPVQQEIVPGTQYRVRPRYLRPSLSLGGRNDKVFVWLEAKS